MLRVYVQMKRLRDFLLGTFNQWIQVRVRMLVYFENGEDCL